MSNIRINHTETHRITRFIQWLRTQHNYDISINNITINTASSERGIIAAQPITVTCSNTVSELNQLLWNRYNLHPLISVPKSLLIRPVDVSHTITEALRNQALQRNVTIPNTLQQFTDYEFLCIFLIYHYRLNTLSQYKPYIDVLPTSYTCIQWLKQHHIHQLSQIANIDIDTYNSHVSKHYIDLINEWKHINRYIALCNGIHFDYTTKCTVLPLSYTDTNTIINLQSARVYNLQNVWSAPITLTEYQWAYSTVGTRSCYLPSNRSSSNGEYILVPFLDMLNHSNTISTLPYYNHTDQCYQLYLYGNTHQPNNPDQLHYNTGDELYISYGAHDNLLLIERYGFCVPNNPHDYVRLNICQLNIILQSMNTQYHLNDMSINILQQCGLSELIENNDYEFKLYTVDDNNSIAWNFYTYIQVIAVQHNNQQSNGKHTISRVVHKLLNDQVIDTNVQQIVQHIVSNVTTQLLNNLHKYICTNTDYIDIMLQTYCNSQTNIIQSIHIK